MDSAKLPQQVEPCCAAEGRISASWVSVDSLTVPRGMSCGVKSSPLDATRIRAGLERAPHVMREARGGVETPFASAARGIGLGVFQKVRWEH